MQGVIRRVKLEKLKYCKWMILPVIRILKRAEWIKIFEICFLSTLVFTVEMSVILTDFNTRDL